MSESSSNCDGRPFKNRTVLRSPGNIQHCVCFSVSRSEFPFAPSPHMVSSSSCLGAAEAIVARSSNSAQSSLYTCVSAIQANLVLTISIHGQSKER